MFAAMTTGLVKFDEWRSRQQVKDKLAFARVRVGRNILGPGMFLGIQWVSQADTPIEIHVVDVRTRMNNRVPSETAYKKTEFLVPARGTAWFDDHVIDIGTPPSAGTIEGFAEFGIRYGRPGHVKHDLHIKKQVLVAFNKDGLFERASWQDA